MVPAVAGEETPAAQVFRRGHRYLPVLAVPLTVVLVVWGPASRLESLGQEVAAPGQLCRLPTPEALPEGLVDRREFKRHAPPKPWIEESGL